MKSDVGCLCVLPGWVITHPDLNHAAVRLYAMLAVRLAALGDDDSPTRAALAAPVHGAMLNLAASAGFCRFLAASGTFWWLLNASSCFC